MGLPDTATARYLSGYERPLHLAGGHRQGLGGGCEGSVLLARGDKQVEHLTPHTSHVTHDTSHVTCHTCHT